MSSAEKYLKPEVIRQIKRLDLRAQFIVKGFMQGLHASPFHGFSVEFSEHRKYSVGDDPKDIDWLVYAKTDKYYIKKFEAETNITGYLVMDLSRSMAYTYRQELSKFEYGVCLAAALCYLMIHQQDPVGLVTFDQKIRNSLPPRSKRSHLGAVLSLLARLEPTGETNIGASLIQLAAMLRHRSLATSSWAPPCTRRHGRISRSKRALPTSRIRRWPRTRCCTRTRTGPSIRLTTTRCMASGLSPRSAFARTNAGNCRGRWCRSSIARTIR